MVLLADCLFAQVLSGNVAFQTDSFRSAASQTDPFQEASSLHTAFPFTTAILVAFLPHIFSRATDQFSRTTGPIGTTNPMLKCQVGQRP